MALRSLADRVKATGTKNVDPYVQMELLAQLNPLLQKETQFMAAEGYYTNEPAKDRRQSAVRLIEKIWRSQGCVEALIPYLALNYYDRLVSRKKIPVVVPNPEVNENLFVVCCLTIALKLIIEKFKLSEFLENHDVKHPKHQVVKMENSICIALPNMTITITPMHFTKYFVLKLLQPSHSEHMQTTRSLAHQLIVKSQADIAIAAFKPSIVAASAVLTISTKLFLSETCNKLRTILLNDETVHNNQRSVSECSQEMEKWTEGLGCTLLETDRVPITGGNPAMNNSDDAEMMAFELRWADVVGVSDEPRDVDCLSNLKKATISCFGLNNQD